MRELTKIMVSISLLFINVFLLMTFSITFIVRLLLQSLNIVNRRIYLEKRLPFRDTGITKGNKVCIVGCGSSGLITAKECIDNGLSVTCYEKSMGIGGAFEPGYKGGKFTSSKVVTAWSSFPCTDDTYHWNFKEYVNYLNRFTDHFKLRSFLRFNTEVVSIERTHVDQNTDADLQRAESMKYIWRVTTVDTLTGDKKTVVFDKVILCGGTNHIPRRPTFKNEDAFNGVIMHSSEFRNGYSMKGKNVVVVGLGESGADIAYYISTYAASTFLISRKGPGAVVPRFTDDGIPSDIGTTRAYHALPRSIFSGENVEYLPRWWKLKIWIEDLWLNSVECGDKKTNFISPTFFTRRHWMRSPATKSANFIEAVKEGRMTYKETSIVRLHENSVEFEDGDMHACDVIVCCTGYTKNNAMLPPNLKEINYRNDLFKKCIHPELATSLAFVGFARPNFGTIPVIAELQARLVALVMAGKVTLPTMEEMEAMINADRQYEEWLFSPYYRQLPSLCSYMESTQALCRLLGCDIDWKRLLQNPSVLYKVIFGPIIAAQFRLFGPGEDRKNAVKVMNSAPSVDFAVSLYAGLLLLCAGILSNIGYADPPIGLYLP